jgi:p-hydroxybenzoate 3-monooxygenase
MRSPEVGRLHLRVPNGTDPADWSDERVRDELARNHTGLPFG